MAFAGISVHKSISRNKFDSHEQTKNEKEKRRRALTSFHLKCEYVGWPENSSIPMS